MNKKQFINLFAAFMDIFSLELKDNPLYVLARSVHYELQEFIKNYEIKNQNDNYYDFFYENIVVRNLTSDELLNKYNISNIDFKLKEELK